MKKKKYVSGISAKYLYQYEGSDSQTLELQTFIWHQSGYTNNYYDFIIGKI